jgi:Ca2+-binding EF-hand superfamily protein
MGGACASTFAPKAAKEATAQQILGLFPEDKPGQDKEAADKIARLHLSLRDVENLFQVYNAIDVDRNYLVDIEEFIKYFHLEKSNFVIRVFSLMDEDSSGEIDFAEFALCIWNYCSFDMSSLARFAFDLFDADSDGELNNTEITAMIKEVYGDAYEGNQQLNRLLESYVGNRDDRDVIGWQTFLGWARKTPVILFPAFKMQQMLRKGVLGEKFWKKENEKRMKWGMRVGKSVSIFDLLDDNTDVDAMLNDQDAFAKRMSTWQQNMNPDGSVGHTKKDRKKKRATVALVPKTGNYANRSPNSAVVISEKNAKKEELPAVVEEAAPIAEDTKPEADPAKPEETETAEKAAEEPKEEE